MVHLSSRATLRGYHPISAPQFNPGPSGTIQLTVGGTTAGTFGTLDAGTGAITLGGRLVIQFDSGYVPNVGDRIPILTYGSVTGSFSQVSFQNLPDGRSATLQVNASEADVVIS